MVRSEKAFALVENDVCVIFDPLLRLLSVEEHVTFLHKFSSVLNRICSRGFTKSFL